MYTNHAETQSNETPARAIMFMHTSAAEARGSVQTQPETERVVTKPDPNLTGFLFFLYMSPVTQLWLPWLQRVCLPRLHMCGCEAESTDEMVKSTKWTPWFPKVVFTKYFSLMCHNKGPVVYSNNKPHKDAHTSEVIHHGPWEGEDCSCTVCASPAILGTE